MNQFFAVLAVFFDRMTHIQPGVEVAAERRGRSYLFQFTGKPFTLYISRYDSLGRRHKVGEVFVDIQPGASDTCILEYTQSTLMVIEIHEESAK